MARAGRKRKIGAGIHREANGKVSRVRDVSRRLDGFMDDPHVVYVLESSPLVKVGLSRSPKDRVRTIQTGNGQVVRMCWYRWMDGPNAKKLEKMFHDLHRGQSGHAIGEWYYYSSEDVVQKLLAFIRRYGIYTIREEYNREVEQEYDHATRQWI